jgi:hypothetical protein
MQLSITKRVLNTLCSVYFNNGFCKETAKQMLRWQLQRIQPTKVFDYFYNLKCQQSFVSSEYIQNGIKTLYLSVVLRYFPHRRYILFASK